MMMRKQLTIAIGQYSQAGRKAVNQDFHGAYIPKAPLLSSKGISLALADGISSSQVSQIASATAVQGFLQDYYCTSDTWSVKKSGHRVLSALNSWLFAQTRQSPDRYNKDKGYVCTFSAIIFKSNTAYLFHCGDSRIYRLCANGLEQLTQDHRHYLSNTESYLTRALGIHNTLDLDYQAIAVERGDIFILATDGVYEYLTPQIVMQQLQHQPDDLGEVAQQLVEYAYQQGSADNLTLQIARVDELPAQNIEEVQQQLSAFAPLPKLQPRMQIDDYRIIRALQFSSRSHVWLAEDCHSQQKVVLKTLSTELREHATSIENLMMEDWIAKRLDNAHVLKAMHTQRPRQYLYIITEYIEGQTLTQWMQDHPAPDVATVRRIVVQIAQGLQAFHRQEMVHQDLRPDNIMIDQQGTVKLIDFGSTKVAGINEIVLRNDGLVGTMQYSAPEYFLGHSGDKRADIFSLGVITYQLLSGQLPYGHAICKTSDPRSQGRLRYRSLAVEGSRVPGWVDYAIQTATAVKPLQRYSEVSEFLYDLQHPNARYLKRERPPILQRNPVAFWQGLSFCLSIVIVLLLLTAG